MNTQPLSLQVQLGRNSVILRTLLHRWLQDSKRSPRLAKVPHLIIFCEDKNKWKQKISHILSKCLLSAKKMLFHIATYIQKVWSSLACGMVPPPWQPALSLFSFSLYPLPPSLLWLPPFLLLPLSSPAALVCWCCCWLIRDSETKNLPSEISSNLSSLFLQSVCIERQSC